MVVPEIPILPGTNVGFVGEPPTMDLFPKNDIIEYKQCTYHEWLELLRHRERLRNWEIFLWGSDGNFRGFGGGTRKVFRSIAHQLRSMHNAELYCGDLINRVSIRIPDLVVSFTAHPVSAHLLPKKMKADLSIEEGIKSDMTHFRHMLAMLMNNHLKKKGSLTEFIQLPIDVKLFFSPTFLSLPVKDGSYLQFFHPVFFNGEDRVKFITVVTQYRKINLSYFDENLDLGNEQHKPNIMKEWTKKITDRTLLKVLLQSPTINPQLAVASYYGELPNYMRNVYSHCVDCNKKQSQEHYERELNRLFPAICSRILDCIIHNLDSRVFNGVKFAQILEQQGMGFYSGIWHSDNGRGGDGRGGFGRGGRGRGRGRNGRGRAQGEQQGIGGGRGRDGRGRGGRGRSFY